MGVLVLIILILAFMLYSCNVHKPTGGACGDLVKKSTFITHPHHPLRGGGQNAGASFGNQLIGASGNYTQYGFPVAGAPVPATSGTTPGALPKSVCGPRQVARTYLNPQGAQVTVCTDASGGPDMSTCTSPWDMTATAEAQALAEVGGFQYDTYGERALQAAINSGDNVALTDAQLQTLMHSGGTP